MSDIHERALEQHRQYAKECEDGENFLPTTLEDARYTLRVLEAFEPMRAALELAWNSSRERHLTVDERDSIRAALRAANEVSTQ